MDFKLEVEDKGSKARAGLVNADHGEIQTPIFMPVVRQEQLKLFTKEN